MSENFSQNEESHIASDINDLMSKREDRLDKIIGIMENNYDTEKIDEELDLDEEVPDDDPRFVIACDFMADQLKVEVSNQVKPEYIKFEKYIPQFDMLQNLLVVFSIIFIIFGRPEWCAKLEDNINFGCTRSLDPTNPVEYYFSSPFVLDDKFKMFICLLCQFIILAISLTKIQITYSSTNHRIMFLAGLAIFTFYTTAFWLKTFNIYILPLTDLIMILFLIIFVPVIQKPVQRGLKILEQSFDVVVFLIFYGVVLGSICRVLFSRHEEFYDDNDTPYFTWNFTSISKSFYSGVIATFDGGWFFDSMMYFYKENWFGFLFWFFVIVINKFLIPNFLVGVLAANFGNSYNANIDYILKFPKLTKIIKIEIYKGNYSNERGQVILNTLLKTDDFTSKIKSFEDFYTKTSDGDFNTVKLDNDDSMTVKVQDFLNNKDVQMLFGILEGLSVFIVLLGMEYAEEALKPLFYTLYFFQLLILLRDFSFIMTQNMTKDDLGTIFSIVLTIIVLGMISIIFSNTSPIFYESFSLNNLQFQKILGMVVFFKSIDFYRLILKFELFGTLFYGTIKALTFINDLVGVLGLLFFVYATIGMYFYGGSINSGSPQVFEESYGDEYDEIMNYYNYNDYFHSISTLILVMQIGWGDFIHTTTMNTKASWWNNLFYISYFFFSGVFFYNILMGFVCDNTAALMGDGEKEEGEGEENGSQEENENNGDGGGDGDEEGGDDDDKYLKNKDEENPEDNKEQETVQPSLDLNEDMDLYLDLKKKDEIEGKDKKEQPKAEFQVQDLNEAEKLPLDNMLKGLDNKV